MKKLIALLRTLIILHFCPDNHIIPVLRMGRFQRVGHATFVWTIPLVEWTLPPVKTSLYVGNFVFDEILSQDNIPFKTYLTVLYTFNPVTAHKAAVAQLLRGGDNLLHTIVRDFTNRRLRRLLAVYRADELSRKEVITEVEDSLVDYLTQEMQTLGLKPLPTKDGGVMIKEIFLPDNYKRTMLDVKHNEAILEVLHSYPVPELVQLLIQLIFANKVQDGQQMVIVNSPEAAAMLPLRLNSKG